MKNSWDAYWRNRDSTGFERLIEKYKAQAGYRRIIDTLPEIGSTGRVLEIGAGNAWLSRILKDRGWHTVALDSNPFVVDAASQSVDSYVVGDIFGLPFEDGSFDLVICCGLLEHFNEDDVVKIVSEMARVGGAVAAWLPTCGIAWKVLWSIRNLISGNIYDQVFRYKRKKLETLLRSVGLTYVRSGVVSFAGFFRYLYLYGSLEKQNDNSTDNGC